MTKKPWTNKHFLLLALAGAVIFVFAQSFSGSGKKRKFHTEDDMVRMLLNNTLPTGSNSVFIGSGKCMGCHGNDPVDFANMSSEGVDVNPTDNWRATMMANSAKDPFWRAKVAHEVFINPDHQVELEDKCTSC
ncbi:MAG: hypothetical protein RL220_877, partial [Bacteroidota bacterium]